MDWYQLVRICKPSIIKNRYFFFFHKADLILLYFCLEGSASPPEFLEQYAGYLATLSLHDQAQSSLSSIVVPIMWRRLPPSHSYIPEIATSI
jgi:hypothetical protein